MSKNNFATLPLHADLQKNLESLGYLEMTDIQSQSLPEILKGKDLIAQAKTGSGKTAAFSLGLLNSINAKNFNVQSLVMCPTRELADQVATSIRELARAMGNIKVRTLCGGTAFGPQASSLENGVHIVVGTPGRIEEHLRKKTLKLDDVKTVVLDEADRMLDMGFQEQIDEVMDYAPKQRQTLLFSATFPEKIERISTRVMQSPVMVKVEETHNSDSIEQVFYKIDDSESERLFALKELLLFYRPTSSIVFCNTKVDVNTVCNNLKQKGFSVAALHGDLDQKDRDQCIVRFANKSLSILVATDVAARGLDIENVDAVFNYHVSRETEVHVHRIGRTGRAGNKGIACSLFSEKEKHKISLLEDYLQLTIKGQTLPSDKGVNPEPIKAQMTTLHIAGGKKDKVRAGDILGALTGENGIKGEQVGKINLMHNRAFVAVNTSVAKQAVQKLTQGKLKGRSFKVKAYR